MGLLREIRRRKRRRFVRCGLLFAKDRELFGVGFEIENGASPIANADVSANPFQPRHLPYSSGIRDLVMELS